MASEMTKDRIVFFLRAKQIKTGKIKLQLFFKTWETTYPITQHNIPKDLSVQFALLLKA